MQGRDVAMNIEDSVGGRPWPMGHTKWGKNGINQILKSENGKKEKWSKNCYKFWLLYTISTKMFMWRITTIDIEERTRVCICNPKDS